MTFQVRLTCCGTDDVFTATTREEAESFRDSYLSGPGVAQHGDHTCGPHGHQRTAIIEPDGAGHDWKFLTSHGDDAPGQSKDTYSQCTKCDMVKHDYAHGGGQTSPNYPVYYLKGVTHGAYKDPPCEPIRDELEDLKRVRQTELDHVAASAEEAFAEADDRASAYERWAEETASELGCEAEWSNLHDHFQCIRGAALTDRSYRHSADETMTNLHREVEKLRVVVDVAKAFVLGLNDKTPTSVVPLVCAVESLGTDSR